MLEVSYLKIQRIIPMLIVVLASTLVIAIGVANADFTFGTPTNLGQTINSSVMDADACISTDGLSFYFASNRPGGHGKRDLWVTTRPTVDHNWGSPVNLSPVVNSLAHENDPGISADDLSLFFQSNRPGGYGSHDIWVTIRSTKNDPWREPVNLGPMVNSSHAESDPSISADGLLLYFSDWQKHRRGGYGEGDLWMTARVTTGEAWGEPINLGQSVNTIYNDYSPSISADGLVLFFDSDRPGGYGNNDLLFTMKKTIDDNWDIPVNLGLNVNSVYNDRDPSISFDGYILYFQSNRPGGFGGLDLWQVSIDPVVDLNGDGIVDANDMCIVVDNWGTGNQLCDVGPMPWGDGVVDVEDLIVIAEHLFEEFPPAELVE